MAYTFKSKVKDIRPFRASNGGTETLVSIKARTGASLIINGGYYTMGTGKPESWLAMDGKILATGYNGFGYAVDGDKVVYSYQNNVGYPHFIGAVFRLVHNGKMDMIGGETNKRGRTGMGLTAAGEVVFYVVPDTDTKNKLTSRELAEKMLSLGCVNAIELDGGGSSQFDAPGERYSSGRAVSWWICVWTEEVDMVDGRLVKNFSLQEMENTQAKDYVKLVLTPEVVEHAIMMQELRDWYDKPLNVSSWYRTASFNKQAGGASNSAHLDGRATDINNIPESLYEKFVTAWQVICSNHGKIGGVELYKWGMHFDSYSDKFGFKAFRLKDNR